MKKSVKIKSHYITGLKAQRKPFRRKCKAPNGFLRRSLAKKT